MTNNYRKKLVNLLSPEVVKPNVMYTISLNRKVSPLEVGDSIHDEYNIYLSWVRKRLEPFVSDVLVVFELSSMGKLHCHGTVTFKNEQSVFLFYRMMYGMNGMGIEIDTIDNVQKWMCYVFKGECFHLVFKNVYKVDPIYHFVSAGLRRRCSATER